MMRAARYLGASLLALVVDMGGFLVLLRLGVGPAAAAALAYGLGVVAHWFVSAHAVFVGAVAQGAGRLRQQALFVGSALVGLGVTAGVVAMGTAAGADPRLAKLAAVGVSFAATYLLRARVVFAA